MAVATNQTGAPLPRAMAENVITLLCHDDTAGKAISNLVEPHLFEGDLRILAERAVDYWRQNGEAPKAHTPDLVADILEDKDDRRGQTFRRILVSMSELWPDINAGYVLSTLGSFVRTQKMKAAVMLSAEELSSRGELAIGEVERIWNEMLRARDTAFDSGLRLNEVGRIVDYISKQYGEFATGVSILDHNHIVPFRGGVMLFLGAAGMGKSWFLCTVSKHALLARKRVVYVTLEMGEVEVAVRHYQSLFSLSRRQGEVEVSTIEFDRWKQLSGFGTRIVRPDFTFEAPDLQAELEARVEHFGERFRNLVIKQFPPRSLDANGLRAFLDNLEATDGFIPDLLVLDYIGIMKTDAKNHRISLGRVFEDFRAVCVERNLAGVTAHQISKAGALASHAGATHVAEDWSFIGTADQVVTYSSTAAEHRLGLARLFVDKSRSERDKFGVLITQSYPIGQFCIDAIYLQPKYFEIQPKDGQEEEAPEDD